MEDNTSRTAQFFLALVVLTGPLVLPVVLPMMLYTATSGYVTGIVLSPLIQLIQCQ